MSVYGRSTNSLTKYGSKNVFSRSNLIVSERGGPKRGKKYTLRTKNDSIPLLGIESMIEFSLQDDIKEHLRSKGVKWEESANLMEVASRCDVVYQTRIQRERFGERMDLYEEARGKYIVDQNVLDVMQKHAVIMHPLPRLDEVGFTSLFCILLFFKIDSRFLLGEISDNR